MPQRGLDAGGGANHLVGAAGEEMLAEAGELCATDPATTITTRLRCVEDSVNVERGFIDFDWTA